MSRQRVVVGVGVLAAAAVLLALWCRHESNAAARHPLLVALLAGPAEKDGEHRSVFFRALSALAGPQGFTLDRHVVEGDTVQIRHVDEGYAVRVRSGRRRYVVAVLRGWDGYIPGSDTQYLLLFSPDGELLDTLSCSINARLTRMAVESGTFHTDVLDADEDGPPRPPLRPAAGGADRGQLVPRGDLPCETRRYVWERAYHGEEMGQEALRTADMEREGLCRAAIRDGKFAVLFPRAE
jgi:hypothetical protein